MTFILPLTYILILHGSLFDLTDYTFKDKRVYDDDAIGPLTQVSKINELVAEYRLIETEAEYREFLGVDVASNLKVLVNQYPYQFDIRLKGDVQPSSDRVQIALKVVLKTVNKTVPFDAPQIRDWEIDDMGLLFTPVPIQPKKTHYVKSIVYGYMAIQLIYADVRSSEHKAVLTEALLSSVGRSGTLDKTFSEKFWIVLEENGVYSYGSKYAEGFYPHSIEERKGGIDGMISFKETLGNITEADGQGYALYYEMQPLSLLSNSFPLVEINSDIFNQLDDVEKKYEDVRIAIHEFYTKVWSRVNTDTDSLSNNEAEKVSSFYERLFSIKDDFEKAIRNMDISTFGNIDQFSDAMGSYGNTSDTHKYRNQVNSLSQQLLEMYVLV